MKKKAKMADLFIRVPRRMLEEIDELMGPRKRSAFFRQAVKEEITRSKYINGQKSSTPVTIF